MGRPVRRPVTSAIIWERQDEMVGLGPECCPGRAWLDSGYILKEEPAEEGIESRRTPGFLAWTARCLPGDGAGTDSL